MATETDFNVPPYNDDYDPSKNFHRIMHRPRVAVQARELTQAQSILQNQIERFGNHVFKDGSIVDGVAITYSPKVHYISLADTFLHANSAEANVIPTELDSSYLITNSANSETAVRATIKLARNGAEAGAPETNRFYLTYIVTGKDGANDVTKFSEGDTLYVYSNNQNKFANLDANNLVYTVDTLASNGSFTAEGYTYCVSVSDGIIFQKGFFVRVEPQTIPVQDFSTNTAGYLVGFNTAEETITENEDESLYDNALGYPNENAPGAHRLKLTPTLISKTREEANNTNFFAIVEFDGDKPTEQKDSPNYNIIGDQIAQGRYEESGDYVVVPFQVEPRSVSNASIFAYDVSSGVAIIRGHRIEKIASTRVFTDKATSTEAAQNQIVTGNYGNYVVVDEYLGVFGTEDMQEVSLYDTAQQAISQYEGISSAPSGSEVGKANIRAVMFEEGTKGAPEAKYLLYLFNIRMNSGKSFSSDVKSIYGDGTLGKAKADLVLENGAAVLKDSSKNTLVFSTGLKAVKRLTGNTGIGDTSYVYNQVKSGTILANGSISITIDTAAPGASDERLNYSVGTLGQLARDNFNIFLSQNAYTANLTGTISVNTTSAQVTGTGTSFTTDLHANSNIRIYTSTGSTSIRRVVSIANNTSLTLDSPLGSANATCNFGEYFVGGTPLPLANVTVASNTSFTASLGKTLNSSQTIYCSYPVKRNQTTAIPKIVKKSRFVKIDCSNNAANTAGPWVLGLPDVYNIRNVYVGTTYANTNPERSSWFELDNGQRDDMYDLARLVIKPGYASQINSTCKFLVELDMFSANTAASVGFFSVESYPIDDANTANTTAILTAEIPSYKGEELRNMIDFRAVKANTAVSSTTAAGATINPVSTNSFSFAGTGQYTIMPDTNFEADFEYYLPRYDLVTMNALGAIIINRGVPSTAPRVPFAENDQMVIAEAYVPPFPSLTAREAKDYPGTPSIRLNLKTNRRYTMKDIGTLDERLKRVEFYTVLNVLEQQARDLTIPDANGLDRFKNGIFADPFNSFNLGNVGDFEYRAAIDKDATVLRPSFKNHDIDTIYVPPSSSESVKSSGVKKTGPVVTLDYENEAYIRQPFATKYRNPTESSWQWNGKLTLYPSHDFFRDEQNLPNVMVNLDLSTPWEQFSNTPWGSTYGAWRTTSQQSRSTTNEQRVAGGVNQTTTTTTTTTQQATVQKIQVDTQTENIDLGSYVKDVSMSPFMRSRLVAFVAYGMKPRTTLHALFDDVLVDEHCAPGVLSNIANPENGLEDRVVTPTAAFGSPLVSDENGFICGVFRIPAETFRTGDRTFLLANIDNILVGKDAQITKASSIFTADNLAVTKSSTTINLRQPQLSTFSGTQTRIVSNTSTQTSFVPDQPVCLPPEVYNFEDPCFTAWYFANVHEVGSADPIAQSFSIQNIEGSATGAFITQVGVYFREKDPTMGCSVFICEMENNLPDQSRIIGTAHLDASAITARKGPASGEALVETKFTLDFPVYLMSGKEYAFIVQPDGNSPNYAIWVAETGDFDVTTNQQVFSNPYSGILFLSANRKTWTPVQKEDIAFNLYRARFTETSGSVIFHNENDEYLTVDGFTMANTGTSIQVGDYVFAVNSAANTANLSSIISNTLTGLNGRVQYVDSANGEVWLDSSTANTTAYFSNTTNPTIAVYRIPTANASLMDANTLVSYANVTSVDNLKFHAVVPKFGTLQPALTSVSYGFKGTNLSNTLDAAYTDVLNETDTEFLDYERHVMSRSNEVQVSSTFKSGFFNLGLSTYSDLVSPVINLSRKGTLFIENVINNDANNEHTRYGSALAKAIERRVVLDDGQEAEDIQVRMTASRPNQTDVKVYVKFWNNEDPEAFDDKMWTELQYDDGGDLVYTSPTNPKDYVEYKFSVPTTNAVAQGAFANVNANVYTPLAGTISVANNSSTVTGTGTAFNTDLSVGDRVRIASDDYVAIRTVTNIANSTSMTLDNGLQATNSAAVFYAYDVNGNDGIVEYRNSANSRFIGYKEFALKIVMLSENPVKVPRINDIRAIALQT